MGTGRPIPVTDTAVVSAAPARVYAVVVGVLSAGKTIKLHDCATTGAAAAGNLKCTIATDAAGDYNFGAAGALFDTGVVVVFSAAGPLATVVAG